MNKILQSTYIQKQKVETLIYKIENDIQKEVFSF